MKIYDISWPISPTTTEYKNKKTISFESLKNFDTDSVRDSKICLGAHTGTHVDAPSHFLKDGKTIDAITLDRLIGRAQVLDLTNVVDRISASDLQKFELHPGEIILLKTANSSILLTNPFHSDFVYLDASGAEFLRDKKVRAVGIDYLGIERNDPTHKTHITLMHADIAIIEGLRLNHVQPGAYFCICLPLHIVGLEAAPARAILMSD